MESTDDLAILRPRQVCEMLQISRGTLYVKIHDRSFPEPIQLGRNAIGFKRADILAWIEQQPKGLFAGTIAKRKQTARAA